MPRAALAEGQPAKAAHPWAETRREKTAECLPAPQKVHWRQPRGVRWATTSLPSSSSTTPAAQVLVAVDGVKGASSSSSSSSSPSPRAAHREKLRRGDEGRRSRSSGWRLRGQRIFFVVGQGRQSWRSQHGEQSMRGERVVTTGQRCWSVAVATSKFEHAQHGLRHVQETYRPTYKSCRSRALVLLIVVATNTASVLLFSDAGSSAIGIRFRELNRCIPFSNPGYLCLRDLNVTEYALAASPAELVHLHNRLAIANSLVETLLGDRANASNMAAARDEQKQVAADSLWQRELTGELKLAVGPHKLPLGSTPNMRTEQLFPTLGQACSRFPDELRRYMNYEPGGECPSDELFAQRLMLKGCEPRPRRSILWDAYTCKNYSCLVNRGKTTGTHHYDCKDCFNLLNSQEKRRWTRDDGALSYSIDAVLAAKPNGTVRIGLDIGSGSGTFAARMQERGVTVVTTSMNFDGPFNSFIASRGLVPMHLSIVHRLPFFDGTLDIVHSMHVLSHWIPVAILEFALFDIYRVLRPGGLFWLDHFYCLGGHMNTTYVPMFDRIGFNKVRWNARPKLDRGIKFNEWYVSALLEKPST
ncbi:hypothetical protein ACQ4PT_031291 [Festuca glaucescens]